MSALCYVSTSSNREVKLPGKSKREPEIFPFGTPYLEIHDKLLAKDKDVRIASLTFVCGARVVLSAAAACTLNQLAEILHATVEAADRNNLTRIAMHTSQRRDGHAASFLILICMCVCSGSCVVATTLHAVHCSR